MNKIDCGHQTGWIFAHVMYLMGYMLYEWMLQYVVQTDVAITEIIYHPKKKHT